MLERKGGGQAQGLSAHHCEFFTFGLPGFGLSFCAGKIGLWESRTYAHKYDDHIIYHPNPYVYFLYQDIVIISNTKLLEGNNKILILIIIFVQQI